MMFYLVHGKQEGYRIQTCIFDWALEAMPITLTCLRVPALCAVGLS